MNASGSEGEGFSIIQAQYIKHGFQAENTRGLYPLHSS